MFCANCGTQLDDNSLFCTNCGTKTTSAQRAEPIQNAAVTPSPQNETSHVNVAEETPKPFNERKLRHGFTSFYLYISLVGIGFELVRILFLFFIDDYSPEIFVEGMNLNREYGVWGFWIYLAVFVLNGYNTYRIIRWEKSGFYWLIGTSVIVSFLDIFNSGFIFTLLILGAVVLILFLVLRIRNTYNAKSTWEQLL